MRTLTISLFFFTTLVFLFGCGSTPEIDPGSTVVGRQAPTRPDLIRDQDLSGGDLFTDDLNAQGLRMRGDGFPMDGDQIRGEFPAIYFDFDQSFVRPTDRPVLDQVAERLRRSPNEYLLVEGYCDWKGTTEYNLALGDRRATSVKTYLVNLGIDSSRIEILSKGDLEADPNADAAGRARDRKAELIIIRP